MAYCTLAELTDRYGEGMLVALTDRGETATGAIDADVVERAIADADAQIDGDLATRYALPLAEVPPLVRDIAMALTAWNLHRAAPDPKVEADWREAMRRLRQIAGGTIRLPSAAGVEAAGKAETGARITDRERPPTGANPKGFV